MAAQPVSNSRKSNRTSTREAPQFLLIDGQLCPVRATRGRKTRHVARVLRAFAVDSRDILRCERCADWPRDKHLLFWELLGYDGRYMTVGRTVHETLAGMIGESKRLIQEVTR